MPDVKKPDLAHLKSLPPDARVHVKKDGKLCVMTALQALEMYGVKVSPAVPHVNAAYHKAKEALSKLKKEAGKKTKKK